MSTTLEFERSEAREKFAVARHLIACYLSSRAGLEQLGFLRSGRPLQGDYAEWIVAERLGLQLSRSTVEAHIDATDSASGKTYQIKSRIVATMQQNTSFDFRSDEFSFDFLAAVFFDPTFGLLAILRIPRDVVAARSSKTTSRVSFRWNRACADHPDIERIFWRDSIAPAANDDGL